MRSIATAARAAVSRVRQLVAGSAQQTQQHCARVLRDAQANVTILFGFGAIALVGGVGLAVDTSVAYNVRAQLAAAADAAALAGARAFASPNRDTDIVNFFNFLTSGCQPLRRYSKILVSPRNMKDQLLNKIDREISKHTSRSRGLIRLKTNALEDPDITEALYRASQAGVRVELNVRDTCRLRPGRRRRRSRRR